MTGMWQPDHSGKILSRKTGAVHTAKFDFQTDIPQLKKLYQLVDACIEGTGITVVDDLTQQ